MTNIEVVRHRTPPPKKNAKTRLDPQRVRTSSGERPAGAAQGKQPNTEALCQPPPPPTTTTHSPTLPQDSSSKRLLTISAWKRFIGFFQTLLCLRPLFVGMPWLQRVAQEVGGVCSVAFPKTSATCLFPGLTPASLFWIYMSLPSTGLVIGFSAFLYDRSVACNPFKILRLDAGQRLEARKGLVTRARNVAQLLLIAFSVRTPRSPPPRRPWHPHTPAIGELPLPWGPGPDCARPAYLSQPLPPPTLPAPRPLPLPRGHWAPPKANNLITRPCANPPHHHHCHHHTPPPHH